MEVDEKKEVESKEEAKTIKEENKENETPKPPPKKVIAIDQDFVWNLF